ncbi:FAD-binding protein [Emcibacter nanhaiensis]|uniref:FAD-binding protein n=1 Tax=Emcibacter nanhaiensis TaxID=1505037 RepID=A0A501PKV5_9PROT|nr:FAD-binding protein [Emcibacter nanhaiensis]TPD60728.1 FAD-binding protein [Emcibacter nanhaiensis]
MKYTHDRINEPLKLRSPADLKWDQTHDVLIVGFGGAGVTAALEARDQGADVAIVDRFSGGGATAICGNVIYAGGGTHIQQEAGVEDTPEDMFKYLKAETSGIVGDPTLQRFCDGSADSIRWLEKHGVRFKSSCTLKKTSYPPSGIHLYHSGSELNPRYAKLARPAPRGHIAYGGFRLRATGHPDFYAPLRDSALARGVTPYLQAEAVRLIQERDGQVIGVEIRKLPANSKAEKDYIKYSRRADNWHLYAPGLAAKYRRKAEAIADSHAQPLFLQARKGVILSSGGFVMNRDMVRAHAPRYLKGLALGTSGCNGSGIALGQSVGGATGNMDRITAWRFINPPHAWATGMIVNDQGARYVDETLYGAAIGDAMCLRADGRTTLIINSTLKWRALRQILPWRARAFQYIPAFISMMFKANKGKTIEELAVKVGMDPATVRETLENYNATVRGEKEDDFGKPVTDMQDMSKGPYYAIDVSLDNKVLPCPTLTLGGLQVNEETGEVLREDGTEIKGLYAAGRTAVGIASNAYVSGLSVADCVFSGRRAGAHAAGVT